jgi:hypothetical protein
VQLVLKVQYKEIRGLKVHKVPQVTPVLKEAFRVQLEDKVLRVLLDIPELQVMFQVHKDFRVM